MVLSNKKLKHKLRSLVTESIAASESNGALRESSNDDASEELSTIKELLGSKSRKKPKPSRAGRKRKQSSVEEREETKKGEEEGEEGDIEGKKKEKEKEKEKKKGEKRKRVEENGGEDFLMEEMRRKRKEEKARKKEEKKERKRKEREEKERKVSEQGGGNEMAIQSVDGESKHKSVNQEQTNINER